MLPQAVKLFTFLFAILTGVAYAAAPPPNAPAEVRWERERGTVILSYNGTTILKAAVTLEGARAQTGAVTLTQAETTGEKTEQHLTFTPADSLRGVNVVIEGTCVGSPEAFPAETSAEAQKRFPLVRNSVGLSRNLRNNAVYDRRWDWVLAGPPDGRTRIVPHTVTAERITFRWQSRGPTLALVFRPRLYQKHLGFSCFKPWTYPIWKDSVTGYCTWWAYRRGFTQKILDSLLAVFVEKHLPDFGYLYMQFDDCYQIGNGSAPWNWLTWDKRKFPGGWKYAMEKIRNAGMKPGIWVHRVHRPSDPGVRDIARKHPDWFVPGPDGTPFVHHGFYMLNTCNDHAVQHMIRTLYRGLKEQGWAYVKIDGTGDLLRAYRNKNCAEFFTRHRTTPEKSLRRWDEVARELLGRDVYLLACHTVANARYVIGLVDGARLSNDGFQPRTLAQYNFLEGVVWRNDPDHCDVMGTWLMDQDAMMPLFGAPAPVPARSVIRPVLCSIAGSVLMVSDKVEVYRDDRNLEGMKRSAPVLLTRPGQLYSCGRRTVPWWLQEIDRAFEHWWVLTRIQWAEKEKTRWVFHFKGVPPQEVRFVDLGLAPDRRYVVFEFWTQRYVGTFTEGFTAPAMDRNTGLQTFAIRQVRPHPWVISTTRHISQGGVSLLSEEWDGARGVLSGRSAVVAGDPYVLTVYLPGTWRVVRAQAGGKSLHVTNEDQLARVRILPAATQTLLWEMLFSEGR